MLKLCLRTVPPARRGIVPSARRGILPAARRGIVPAARRAVAAMEFALVAPVLLLMIIGVFDISKAMILRQEVINTAHSISLTASLLAVQTLTTAGVSIPLDYTGNPNGALYQTINGTTQLTTGQVSEVESDIFAEIPWLRSGVEHGQASVTLSGIEFSALPSGTCEPYTTCTYWIPFVAWSVPYQPGTPNSGKSGGTNYDGVNFQPYKRACGPMQSGVLNIYTSQSVPLTLANFTSTLRIAGITYPDPIVVADVSYTYTPAFLRFITGPLTFVASAYWPVRQIPFNWDTSQTTGQPNATPGSQLHTGELTIYDLAGADLPNHCANYP